MPIWASPEDPPWAGPPMGAAMGNYIFEGIFKKLRFLEKKPLEQACKNRNLSAYKFKGFWKCMDTLRDKQVLEKIIKKRLKK